MNVSSQGLTRFLQIFLLIIVLFACAGTSIMAQSANRIALIVAIGQYEAGSGWQNLGAENDVPLLRSSLMMQGFDSANIHVIVNEAATYEGIKSAIQHQLIDRAKEGDIAVFHFSGHGQQVVDDNEDEIDGYDEALVPFDSPLQYQEGTYRGERLLRDDEVGSLLLELRKKLGESGQLLSILDACHSGTGTRGYATTRGTEIKMEAIDASAISSSITTERGYNLIEEKHASAIAPMIALFASAAQELNYEYRDQEGRSYGSLSYAFSKVFSNLGTNTSYQALVDKIQLEMTNIAPRQHMQAEGKMDLLVFDGNTQQIPPYMKVLRWFDDRTIIIDGGSLSGIYPGTSLRFYPIGTTDTSNAPLLGRGVVAEENFPLISDVSLVTPMKREDALNSWVFVEEKNYGNIQMSLLMQLSNPELVKAMEAAIGAYPMISLTKTTPDLLVFQERDSIYLQSKDDLIFARYEIEAENPENLTYRLISRMLEFGQAGFLRQLDMSDRYMNLKIELVKVQDREMDSTKQGGIFQFKEGDSFYFRVSNVGKKAVYYAILDIQSNHEIVQLFPSAYFSIEAEECYLKPGEVHEWTCCPMEVYPPYGNDVLKLIATEVPLNLNRIIETRGNSAQSNRHPFETLFQSSYKYSNGNRGPTTPSIPPSSASVKGIVFQILPR